MNGKFVHDELLVGRYVEEPPHRLNLDKNEYDSSNQIQKSCEK